MYICMYICIYIILDTSFKINDLILYQILYRTHSKTIYMN